MNAVISPQPLAVGEMIQKTNESIQNQVVNPKKSYADQLRQKQTTEASSSKLDLCPVTVEQGEPTIEFTVDEVNEFTREEGLHQAAVMKFSYGRPDLQIIRRNFETQLEVQGRCNIGQLDFRHLLVRFDLFEDYVKFLSRSTGCFKGNDGEYFYRTFPWTLGFNPKEETSMAVIWISLPGLSPNFFAKRSVMSIASAVGKSLAVDKATNERTRPSTARIKVLVDLLAKHPNKVRLRVVDKHTNKSIVYYQIVVYDNLPQYCLTCKHQGHNEESCRFSKEKSGQNNDAIADRNKPANNVNTDEQLRGDARELLNAIRDQKQARELKFAAAVSGSAKPTLVNARIEGRIPAATILMSEGIAGGHNDQGVDQVSERADQTHVETAAKQVRDEQQQVVQFRPKIATAGVGRNVEDRATINTEGKDAVTAMMRHTNMVMPLVTLNTSDLEIPSQSEKFDENEGDSGQLIQSTGNNIEDIPNLRELIRGTVGVHQGEDDEEEYGDEEDKESTDYDESESEDDEKRSASPQLLSKQKSNLNLNAPVFVPSRGNPSITISPRQAHQLTNSTTVPNTTVSASVSQQLNQTITNSARMTVRQNQCNTSPIVSVATSAYHQQHHRTGPNNGNQQQRHENALLQQQKQERKGKIPVATKAKDDSYQPMPQKGKEKVTKEKYDVVSPEQLQLFRTNSSNSSGDVNSPITLKKVQYSEPNYIFEALYEQYTDAKLLAISQDDIQKDQPTNNLVCVKLKKNCTDEASTRGFKKNRHSKKISGDGKSNDEINVRQIPKKLAKQKKAIPTISTRSTRSQKKR